MTAKELAILKLRCFEIIYNAQIQHDSFDAIIKQSDKLFQFITNPLPIQVKKD